jgi:Outer membrane protein beta-barrel domain
MKKVILLAFCCALFQASAHAQAFKWGIRAGLSTPDIKPADVNPFNTDSLKIKVKDANYGFHFGMFARLKAGGFFVQPEVLFNSSKVTYGVSNLNGKPLVDSLRNERFLNLDIPVLLGVKLGAFRLNGGPVGHLHLTSTSDLTQFSSFKSKFETMTFGYQAGLGADFGNLGVDIRYEGNFAKFGSHLNFNGKDYSFDKNSSRILISFGIGF